MGASGNKPRALRSHGGLDGGLPQTASPYSTREAQVKQTDRQTDCLFPILSAPPDLGASQRWARRHPETARGRNPDMASAWSWHGTWMMLGNKKPESQLQRGMSRVCCFSITSWIRIRTPHLSTLCQSIHPISWSRPRDAIAW